MRNEFTAIIHRDGDWYWAYCPEVPGANGQGRTLEDVRQDLAEAIDLMLEVMREEGLAEAPPGSRRETVTIDEGRAHSIWRNGTTGQREMIPRHAEIADALARKICRSLGVPEVGRGRGTGGATP